MGALGLRKWRGGSLWREDGELQVYLCVRAKCYRLHRLNVLLTTVVKEGGNHSTELIPRSE